MKRILLLVMSLMALSPALMAVDRNKKAKEDKKAEASVDTTEIRWLSLDEVQVAMKKEPRKVWFDVYTDWCGWCKVMDKKTFSNTHVIRYMNQKFYAVKLNAEQQDSIRFMGKWYGFVPENKVNQFAFEIMHGQLSYPTGVFMEENFQNGQLIPGYQDVKAMEMILKYLGEGIYKTTPFQDFQKDFVPSWL